MTSPPPRQQPGNNQQQHHHHHQQQLQQGSMNRSDSPVISPQSRSFFFAFAVDKVY